MADPRLRTLLTGVCAMALLISGCTASDAEPSTSVASPSADSPSAGSRSGGSPSGAISSGAGAPESDRLLVADLVAAINATAGGPVSDQQSLLQQLSHPDYLAQQQQCPPATITIGLDPVLTDLAATPGWSPDTPPGAAQSTADRTDSGQTAPVAIPTGTLYRLPVLVLVYTDTRRTGTDLTSLRISVLEGRAFLFPLCLN